MMYMVNAKFFCIFTDECDVKSEKQCKKCLKNIKKEIVKNSEDQTKP